ncbi:uncharacterized protein LOC142586980 [Dermacentor variabilis]|uniref:uncharacterized protein LOC142586980 n=1 Tax=Dermacentor variabilis TaxID=34621 RepID=UPI003F5C6EAA
MASRSVAVIVMTVMLAATLISAYQSGEGNCENCKRKKECQPAEKPEENPKDTLEGAPQAAPEINAEENHQEKPGEEKAVKRDVDIATFYAAGEHIWILGLSGSQYPCMLDVVQETNETFTSFTRLIHKAHFSLQSKDLLGKVIKKPTAGNTYNTMEVSLARPNSRHAAITGSWNSSEIMLYESIDKKCALFSTTYYERPSMLPLKKQKYVMNTCSQEQKDGMNTCSQGMPTQSVEYNFRLKNSIGTQEKAQECMQELISQREAREENAEAIGTLPKLSDCRKTCRSRGFCSAASQEEDTAP